MLKFAVKLAAAWFVCHPSYPHHFKLAKSTVWRWFPMWKCVCFYLAFLLLLIHVLTQSLWPWTYKQIVIVQQYRLNPCTSATVVIGKNFVGKKWQNFNTDKSFCQRRICPRKTLNNKLFNIFKILGQSWAKLKRQLVYLLLCLLLRNCFIS